MVDAVVFVKHFKALLAQTSVCINQLTKKYVVFHNFSANKRKKEKPSVNRTHRRAQKHVVTDGMDGAQRVLETFRGFNNIEDRKVESGVESKQTNKT